MASKINQNKMIPKRRHCLDHSFSDVVTFDVPILKSISIFEDITTYTGYFLFEHCHNCKKID